MTSIHIEFYRRRITGKWSWRIIAANGVNWASPSKGFASLWHAERSVDDLITELGGDPKAILREYPPSGL